MARRDWPSIVVEEMARALFWFHPAVWWLVERIQESREQLVDRLVVARIPAGGTAGTGTDTAPSQLPGD